MCLRLNSSDASVLVSCLRMGANNQLTCSGRPCAVVVEPDGLHALITSIEEEKSP